MKFLDWIKSLFLPQKEVVVVGDKALLQLVKAEAQARAKAEAEIKKLKVELDDKSIQFESLEFRHSRLWTSYKVVKESEETLRLENERLSKELEVNKFLMEDLYDLHLKEIKKEKQTPCKTKIEKTRSARDLVSQEEMDALLDGLGEVVEDETPKEKTPEKGIKKGGTFERRGEQNPPKNLKEARERVKNFRFDKRA